jgi:chemotaxis family two-component system response regulator Rcp1
MRKILLVEDSPGYIVMIKASLADSEMEASLYTASDGEEALRWVRANLPDLVLLDYNLPGISGLDVLDGIRRDGNPDVRLLPVIVLTSSQSEADVKAAYRHGANAYIVKPWDPTRMLNCIDDFWFQLAAIPNRPITIYPPSQS